jgi:hypothetical protein
VTFSINKPTKIAIVTLAIVPLALSLSLSPAHAQSPAIGQIQSKTVKIARNSLLAAPVEESDDDDSDTEASSALEKSMAYVKSGYESEQAGNKELALANYLTGMQVDPTNGHAFLMAGNLLGNTENGIDCLKIALELFKAQGDLECYKITYELLETF